MSNMKIIVIKPKNIIIFIISGVLYIKEKIDFEKIETIDLNLVAYDTGHPQLSTIATIFIKVINVNDNPPIFNQVSFIQFYIILIYYSINIL